MQVTPLFLYHFCGASLFFELINAISYTATRITHNHTRKPLEEGLLISPHAGQPLVPRDADLDHVQLHHGLQRLPIRLPHLFLPSKKMT